MGDSSDDQEAVEIRRREESDPDRNSRISLRITDAQADEVEQLVEEGVVPNKSEALRRGLSEFLRRYHQGSETVDLQEEHVDQLFSKLEDALLTGKKCLSDTDDGIDEDDVQEFVVRATEAYKVLMTAHPQYRDDHHSVPPREEGQPDAE
jgi:Arc/MetJ-type ribon-helix-helix transcriptional regulator